tara:strand:+ start:607 stop:1104 length:498 start_codon:yes stop_codon:yes gene_type:complete
MEFLKIDKGESKIVTLTNNEVKEEKNQWGSWTYNHIVSLDGNLVTFSATEKAQEQLVNYKAGDVVKISKIALDSGGTKYMIEKNYDAGENLGNIKTIINEKEDGNAISRHGFVLNVFVKMLDNGTVKPDIYNAKTQKVMEDCVTYVKTGKITETSKSDDEVELPF